MLGSPQQLLVWKKDRPVTWANIQEISTWWKCYCISASSASMGWYSYVTSKIRSTCAEFPIGLDFLKGWCSISWCILMYQDSKPVFKLGVLTRYQVSSFLQRFDPAGTGWPPLKGHGPLTHLNFDSNLLGGRLHLLQTAIGNIWMQDFLNNIESQTAVTMDGLLVLWITYNGFLMQKWKVSW